MTAHLPELRLARIALQHAGVEAARQRDILARLAGHTTPAETAAERDQLIRDIYQMIGGGYGSIPGVVRTIGEFALRHWPSQRDLMTPPPGCSELRLALWRLCRVCEDGGKTLPPSERTIYRACEPCQKSENGRPEG